MSNKITQIDDNSIDVNGKLIIRDTDGDWLHNEELKPSEEKAVLRFIQSIEREKEAPHFGSFGEL